MRPWGRSVHTEIGYQRFSGIGGDKATTTSDTLAHVPGWPGYGFGEITYTAHLLNGSSIPSSFSCRSMRNSFFVICCLYDSIYIPLEGQRELYGKFIKVPLIWTGHHYLLPMDNWGQNNVNVVFFNAQDVESSMNIEYPYNKVVCAKDWESLESAISTAIGCPLKINRNTGARWQRAEWIKQV